jgi:DNA repair exonuclease SbcCD ATPase subunit
MFNLFPPKRTVEDILDEARFKKEAENLATGVVNGVYEIIALKNELQHQLDLNKKLQSEIDKWEKDWDEQNKNISEFTKEVNGLRHLKQENADLLELLAKYKDGYQGSCYACEPVGILNQNQEKEIEKLNLQIVALNKIIQGAKTTIDNQKHPMYPLHWGGYTDETPWETASADLALRVVKLERELDKIKKHLNPKQDPNYDYFKKHGKWNWDGENNNSLHKGY